MNSRSNSCYFGFVLTLWNQHLHAHIQGQTTRKKILSFIFVLSYIRQYVNVDMWICRQLYATGNQINGGFLFQRLIPEISMTCTWLLVYCVFRVCI